MFYNTINQSGAKYGRNKKASEFTGDLVVELVSSLIDSVEAARIIGVTQTSVKRSVENGELFGIKIGTGLYCLLSECEKFTPKPIGRPNKQF